MHASRACRSPPARAARPQQQQQQQQQQVRSTTAAVAAQFEELLTEAAVPVTTSLIRKVFDAVFSKSQDGLRVRAALPTSAARASAAGSWRL